jgi:type I restriction enzyme S subunit
VNVGALVLPLGDLCSVLGGGTPPKDRPEYYNGDIPWATVRDMRSEVIEDTEFKITRAAVSACATNVIPAGNVVIATRVGLGKVCLIEQATAINQDLRGVIPRDPQRLTVKYLFWWLKSVAHLIEREGTGATVQGVKLPFIKSLGLPLGSIDEQRRIVAILDEAFKGIATAKANTEKNLQNTRELCSRRLESMFVCGSGGQSWPDRRLEQVATITNGFAFNGTDFQREPGVRSIKIANVGVREFIEGDSNYLPAAFAKNYPSLAVSQGTIVLALTRTLIAGGLKVALVPHAFDGALLNQRVAAIQAHAAELDASFLLAFLSTRSVVGYVKSRVNTLMQPNLSITDLRQLPVPLPPLTAQRELVAALARFEQETRRLQAAYERKLAALDELKRSLLHQAFTGVL